MKKMIPTLLALLMLAMSVLPMFSCGSTEEDVVTLYVYNWGEYISDGTEGSYDTNAEFEKYYAAKYPGKRDKVNYSTFSSNESMYAKVSSGSAKYDVIIPSDYMIQRMVKEKLLMPLDISKIPNYAFVDEKFKGDAVYYEDDSDNIYSVPYFYGMVGIIYNTATVDPADVEKQSWDLMWNSKYSGNILQFNNSRDAFGTALYKLQYDVNDATEEQWNEALDLLIEQKGIVQGYVMDEIFNKMQSGSAAIAAYYAGDYLSMHDENEDLAFYYPTEGTNIYVDAMCVPKNAQNPDVAMEYINFMCSRDAAMANAIYTYYASPMSYFDESSPVYMPEYREEIGDEAYELLYGPTAVAARDNEHTQAYMNLEVEELERLNVLWEQLKAESRIGNGIYIGCGVILAALAVYVIAQILRKRRWAKLYD